MPLLVVMRIPRRLKMKRNRMLAFCVAVMLLCVGGAAHAELLVYYNCDEASGTVLMDQSGNGSNATFTVGSGGYSPPVIWSGSDKPVLNLPNVASARITDNVNKLSAPDPNHVDGLKSFTLMMWVEGSPYNDFAYPAMAWKNARPGGGHAGFSAYWNVGNGSLNLAVGGESSNTVVGVSSNPVGALTGWHHWVVTYDGTNMTTDDVHFYLDGAPIGSGVSHQSTVLANDLDLYIGSRGDVDYSQRRLFDEFRLYGSATDSSGALSQEMIQEIMGGAPSTCAMLLAVQPGLSADLSRDCYVNEVDLNMLSDEWLVSNEFSVLPGDPCLEYYGFLGIGLDENSIRTYQQSRMNSVMVAVGHVNPNAHEAIRILGEAGIGVIANWGRLFIDYPEVQWAGEIDRVKGILDTFDVTKYIVLNLVYDEPEGSAEDFNPMIALIKSAFPGIPTYVNWGGLLHLYDYAVGTTADVVGFDYYVWPNNSGMSDEDYYDSKMDTMVAAIKQQAPGKPIVVIGQCAPYPDSYHPTTAQMQMYADTALADPCICGLLYWAWELGDFDQADLDMFEAIGVEANLPRCLKLQLIGQDYEGSYDWGLVQDPWVAGEGLTYYSASGTSVFQRDWAWQVVFSNLSSYVDRRAYNTMQDAVTDDDDFSLVFHTRNFNKGNSGSDLGFIGLFDSDSPLTHDPFVGVNLGAPLPNRDPSLMLQVQIGTDTYCSSSPSDYVVDYDWYYRVRIDYSADSRTFDYTVIDPNNGATILIDSYAIDESNGFSFDAFGASDHPTTSDGSGIDMGIDMVTVNVEQSELVNCQDILNAGEGLAGDLSPDCIVDLRDFGVFAVQWLTCNDPQDEDCQ